MADDLGTEPGPGRPDTINGAIEVWLRLHNSPKHLVGLRHFVKFAGTVALPDVTPDLLHGYHDHLLKARYRPHDKNGKPIGKSRPYAPETISNYVRDAVSVMRLAAKRKWCEMPDVPDLDKSEFTDRSIPWDELCDTMAALPDRAGRILRFIAVTGCRVGEARRLEWDQVKIAIRKCVLPTHKTSKKTGEPRILALNDAALDVLRETPRSDRFVFLSRHHRPYTVSGLRSIVRRHFGENHTTYDLRHSFAQAMIDSGEQAEVVTRLLGHKSSKMVWTYSRIRDERLVEAAQVLKLRKGA